MAISGGEDVFGGGHDDGGPCDHDCHGNGEIVKLTGLELSPHQCWLCLKWDVSQYFNVIIDFNYCYDNDDDNHYCKSTMKMGSKA